MAAGGINPDERSHTVTHAVIRCQQGNVDAESELVFLLKEKLRLISELESYVRRHLPEILWARVDTEALVYEAIADLLMGIRQNRFPHLESREYVRKLLFKRVADLLGQVLRDNLQRGIRNAALEVRVGGLIDHLEAGSIEPEEEPSSVLNRAPVPSSPIDFERLAAAREILSPVDPMAMSVLDGLLAGRTIEQIARSKKLGLGNVRNIIRLMIDALRESESHGRRGEGP
jgi:hypothetical protein